MAEYIKRESAIEAIISDPPDAHYQSWYAEKIKAIPAADVALVRHGRWDDEYKCTVCHNEAFFIIRNIRQDYDYDWEETSSKQVTIFGIQNGLRLPTARTAAQLWTEVLTDEC